jgi:hypothetical protein
MLWLYLGDAENMASALSVCTKEEQRAMVCFCGQRVLQGFRCTRVYILSTGIYSSVVGSEDFTAVTMWSTVFWDVTPCIPIEI